MKLTLKVAWKKRAKLRAEGAKLRAEGDKLRAEGDKLWAESDKLWAEGDKLWAEGDKLWAEAVIEIKGNITIEWTWVSEKKDYRCTLGTGEVFEP
jgi:hypothetical protein